MKKTQNWKHIDKNQSKGRIWLYGACYDEEIIGELIFNAQLCVSPGNVGLTAMHSLVYGTPVITHNNFSNQSPEFEAIIDGKTGSFSKKIQQRILPIKFHYGSQKVRKKEK